MQPLRKHDGSTLQDAPTAFDVRDVVDVHSHQSMRGDYRVDCDARSKSQSMIGEWMKRAVDLVAASLGLLVLMPLFLLIAALVRMTSPGPVFYRGPRTGRYGKPFRIFKFRSMVHDADRLGGTTTGKNDPRVTAVGSVLRKYKLDELPQLLNVVRGEMSLVGPRPEVAEYTDRYTEEERLILTVRPGITDYSSLEFNDLQEAVGEGDPDENFRRLVLPRKNELRLKYVRERSFLGDLRILLRTVWVLASKPLRRTR